MPGIKTINKYTCADCENHKCTLICKGGKRSCNGRCICDNRRWKCTRKICSNFVLDKLVSIC